MAILVQCIEHPIYDSEPYPICLVDETTLPSFDGDYPLLAVNQLLELIGALVATPPEVQIGVAFMAAFTVPLICYVSAWALSKVINFI